MRPLINYDETRFNKERGYIIESRRGGGGYIRIVKIRSDDIDKTVEADRSHWKFDITKRGKQHFSCPA